MTAAAVNSTEPAQEKGDCDRKDKHEMELENEGQPQDEDEEEDKEEDEDLADAEDEQPRKVVLEVKPTGTGRSGYAFI